MRLFFCTFLLLASVFFKPLYANQDSILSYLATYSSIEQIDKLFSLANEYQKNDPQLSSALRVSALKKAEENQSDSLLCQAYLKFGLAKKLEGEYDTAQHYLEKSFKKCQLFGDSMALGSYYRLTGNIWNKRGDLAKASENFFKAIRIFENLDQQSALGKTYNDMALLYNGGVNKDYVKALDYFNQAYEIFLPLGDTNNLSVLYLNMGFAYYGIGKYDSAIAFLNLDINWNRKNNRTDMLIMDLNVLSNVYQKKGQNAKAQETSKDALELARSLNNDPITIQALVMSTYLHLKLKQGKEAVTLAKEGLKLTEKMGSNKKKLTFYQYIELGYELQNDKRNAYKYLKLYSHLKDSILNAEKNKQILELETQYETEKKDAEIALLTTQKKLDAEELRSKQIQQMGLWIFVLVLVGFFAFVLFTTKTKNKLKQQLLESELQEMRTKIKGLLENAPDAIELSFETLNTKLNEPLSEREFEVLDLILQGLGNKQIAEKLFITIHTVKFHLSNIYTKLGVANRKEALQFVISVA